MSLLIVKHTARKGLGVFANAHLWRGLRMCLSQTVEIDKPTSGSMADAYAWQHQGRYLIPLSNISLMNDSSLPNARVEFPPSTEDPKRFTAAIVTLREIRRGTEVTVSYGVKPWWKKGSK